jgi:parallel beta-helix repeat protein
VKYISVAALPANTYANGSSGVGATLTANANGALSVDGVAVAMSDRVMIKDEATQSHNGIYVVTAVGDGSNPYVLTRSTDMDQSSEIQGAFALATAGGTNANTGWVVTSSGPYTVGTTDIVFSKFTTVGITAGNGLQQIGTVLSVLSANSSRVVVSGSGVDLASGVVTPGTYPKVMVDTYGRVVGSASLVAGDIPTISESQVTNLTTDLASKLPLAGGTMSGGINLGSNKITGLANGTNPTDAAAFGQLPTSASTIGGLMASNNLSDVANVATSFGNIKQAASFSSTGVVRRTVFNVMDYGAVGNGTTDDYTAIAAAITDAAVNGGTVYLPSGFTFLTGSTIVLPSKVALQGGGRTSTTLTLANGVNSYLLSVAGSGSSFVTDIEIYDLKINGNALNQGTFNNWINLFQVQRFKLHGCWITNAGGSRGNGVQYSEYYNNHFDTGKNGSTAIALGGGGGATAGSIYNRVYGNFVTGFTGGINIDDVTNLTHDNIVYGNHFFDDNWASSGGTRTGGDCILIGGANTFRNTVTGNIVSTYGEDGIRLTDSTSFNTVTGNTVTSIHRYGIVLATSNVFNTITGNTVDTCGSHGLFIDGGSAENTITGNTFSNNSNTGVYLNSGCQDNVISSNVVYGNTVRGIYVLSTNGGNTIKGNRVNGVGVTTHGIYLLSTPSNTVQGNIVKNCTSTGIRVEDSLGSATQNNIITGNRVYDDQATKTQTTGINETGSHVPDNNTYTNNDVTGNKTTGMSLVGPSNVVGNNQGF